MNRVYYLYKITVGGKSYIGTAIDPNRRLRKHTTYDSLIGKALRKYGLDTAKLKILAKSTSITKIYKLEREAIVRFKTRYPNGYNVAKSGNGCPGTDEWLKAVIAGAKKRANGPGRDAWIENCRKAVQARKDDPEILARQRESAKKRAKDPDWIAAQAAGIERRSHSSWKENQAASVRRGEQHPFSKLTERDVRNIRRLKDEHTYQELGIKFNVDFSTIYRVISGKSWAWLS